MKFKAKGYVPELIGGEKGDENNIVSGLRTTKKMERERS